MNQKGQMSTETIIVLILAVIVAVAVILYLTGAFGNLSPFVSSSNVNSIVTECGVSCTTNSVFDFCSRTFTLNNGPSVINNATCNYLAQAQSNLGVSPCSSVQCNNIVIIPVPVPSLSALQSQYCAGNTGKTVEALIGNSVQSLTC